MKNTIQRMGKFLSAMVMPNIGALIAFGFFAALFIDRLVSPQRLKRPSRPYADLSDSAPDCFHRRTHDRR